MENNTIENLKKALDKLSLLLDQQNVRDAIGKIPDSLIDPVIQGLITILNVIKQALVDLSDEVTSVGELSPLFESVDELLEAAEGLAPGQKDTLDSVQSVISTLGDISESAGDIQSIITTIGTIITKLGSL